MIVENIDTKDISVVEWGGIDEKYTLYCLRIIRKYLPCIEIILSTWESYNIYIYILNYNILIFNKEIEDNIICHRIFKALNDSNVQNISTQNGIKKAYKKYILKSHTYNLLFNNNFWGCPR